MRRSRPSPTARRATSADVAIIGAGAAGLACARELLSRGKNVVILEARDRIGGRIHTTRFSDLELPVELGAEFIHGAAHATYARADDLGLVYSDTAESHLIAHGAGASIRKADDAADLYGRMDALFKKLDPNRQRDRSVAAFLEAHRKSCDAATLGLARSLVEGFEAADLNLMGERALALAEGDSDDETMKASRLIAGYQRLMDGFLEGIESVRSRLRLSSIVKSVQWKRGSVRLSIVSPLGFPLEGVMAEKLVCTLPIGVLKAPPGAEAAVDFQPDPPGLRSALSGVEMGHALRIVFRFHSRFWEELAPPEHKEIGYLHAGAETDFPTWWTTMPVRSPVMTAWQGGPRAAQLALLPEHARVDTALTTLARLLGCKRQLVERELQGWKTHNWSHDPFSLGGYSYAGVDGTAGAARLALPIEDTLYFAGEAICDDVARGTVDGAIQSGVRAARQILR